MIGLCRLVAQWVLESCGDTWCHLGESRGQQAPANVPRLTCHGRHAVAVSRPSQSFQNIFPITDIATYRLTQPRGQCSENHLKCITRWEGRDGVTITIFFQHTRDGHETGYL